MEIKYTDVEQGKKKIRITIAKKRGHIKKIRGKKKKRNSVRCEQSQNVETGQCQIRYKNRYANVGRAKGDYAPTSISQLSAIEDNFSLSIGRNHAQQPACPS